MYLKEYVLIEPCQKPYLNVHILQSEAFQSVVLTMSNMCISTNAKNDLGKCFLCQSEKKAESLKSPPQEVKKKMVIQN